MITCEVYHQYYILLQSKFSLSSHNTTISLVKQSAQLSIRKTATETFCHNAIGFIIFQHPTLVSHTHLWWPWQCSTLHIYTSTSCHNKPHAIDLLIKSYLLIHKYLLGWSFLWLWKLLPSVTYILISLQNPIPGVIKPRVDSQAVAATGSTAFMDVGTPHAIPMCL